MADPVSGSIIAAELAPEIAASIPALTSVAAAPTITGALNTGIATGGSLFGQGGTLSNVGQGLSVFNQANQAFGGNQQPMQMAPAGQISRGQIQPMDYMSLLNPQNQTVIRTPQISLLG